MKISVVNNLKGNAGIDLKVFKMKIKKVSIVGWLFSLYTIKPNKTSIFAQHIYNAFFFIHNEDCLIFQTLQKSIKL